MLAIVRVNGSGVVLSILRSDGTLVTRAGGKYLSQSPGGTPWQQGPVLFDTAERAVESLGQLSWSISSSYWYTRYTLFGDQLRRKQQRQGEQTENHEPYFGSPIDSQAGHGRLQLPGDGPIIEVRWYTPVEHTPIEIGRHRHDHITVVSKVFDASGQLLFHRRDDGKYLRYSPPSSPSYGSRNQKPTTAISSETLELEHPLQGARDLSAPGSDDAR